MGKIYNKGIVSPKGFDMSAAEPADQREIVQDYIDLISLPKCYPGIEVKVVSLGFKKYKLIANDSSQLNNWEEVMSGSGEIGPEGPPGPDGEDGKSAYEVYVENGGQLSETEWLASLQGPEGVPGKDGSGVTIQGSDLIANILIKPGIKGDMWISNDSGTDDLGNVVNAGDGIVFDGSGWVTVGPIRGPQGVEGPIGPEGPEGPEGTDATLEYDITASINVGGIDSGDIIPTGTSLTEFVQDLISPVLMPTIKSNPTVVFSGVTTSTMEIGTSYTAQGATSFTRGSIDSKDSHPDVPLVGVSTGQIYSGTDISGSGAINTNIISGVNRWQVTEVYDTGIDPYYDSTGTQASNLDASRVSGGVSDYSNTITGYYKYWWSAGSIPTDSVGVRALSENGYFPTNTFDIFIPAGVKPVAFYLPDTHGTVTVNHIESSNYNVTNTFTPIAMSINDAGGTAVGYTRFETTIPGVGYTDNATYRVTIN